MNHTIDVSDQHRPSVLVVEDDAALRAAVIATLEVAGWHCHEADDGGVAERMLEDVRVDVVVSDLQMAPVDGFELLKRIRRAKPDLPVMLMTAHGTVERAVSAMRDGAVDFLEKPFEPEVLVTKLAPYAAVARDDGALVAEDPATLKTMELARRVAQTEAAVLLTGESGVGKEVFFRYIHSESPRRDRAPVAINCAAIPENMLEAILFGYEKGAFTGAYKSTPGKFEAASGSSLLLDEISEMSLPLQAKLLRVLQEREVERLGGNKVVELDVRVVATTNRDLKVEVREGRFREDLYFRLNVFPIAVPPLRRRPQDIEPLAQTFRERANERDGLSVPGFEPAALEAVKAYRWPGNVRELENVVRRAAILAGDRAIGPEHLILESDVVELDTDLPLPPYMSSDDASRAGNGALDAAVRSEEFRVILEALKEGAGSRKHAADKLGISARTLRYKLAQMREAGIELP